MKITRLEINNFKFHKDLQFDINGNLLIYGENGVGKSSIYEALKSNLYVKKVDETDIRKLYINRDSIDQDVIVNIKFDDEYHLNRIDNTLTNEPLLDNLVVYMANEKTLSRVFNDKDFYHIIDTSFKYEFPELQELLDIYNAFEVKINRNISIDNKSEFVAERIVIDSQFSLKFNEILNEDSINKIISDKFREDFKIEFIINDSIIDENNKLIRPTIRIKIKDIDDRNNLHNHFNEAKLKLMSIAIYFALAKKFETEKDTKLLILDDFLTSLDMANRKLIVQYILEDFNEYQLFILTHNFQFFNLIKKLTKDLDIKKIYYSKVSNKSEIINQEESYIIQAQDRLDAGDLESCGNFLRKEFERIGNEFESLLELGRVEDLSSIISALGNNNIYLKKPHKNINIFYEEIKTIISSDGLDSDKISKINDKLNAISNTRIDLNKKIIDANGNEINTNINVSLKKVNFYNGILLNPMSHDHDEIEKYQKECENIIVLLENINKGIYGLKNCNYI